VGGQALPFTHVGREAAEVDQPPDSGRTGGGGERRGRLAVGALEGRRADGVDQVVGDVHLVHRGLQRRRVGGVGPHDLDVVDPGMPPEPVRVTGQHPDPVSGGQQLGDESTADVAGGAGDKAEQTAAGNGVTVACATGQWEWPLSSSRTSWGVGGGTLSSK
jgi:hypothetical protein